MKAIAKRIEIEAWPVRELNRLVQHDWYGLPEIVRKDYENPQGVGAWVFGALIEDRDPYCVERWPECRAGQYDPRCCRFPKACSCAVDKRGICVPTPDGNIFAMPEDWIILNARGFGFCKPDVFTATYELQTSSIAE